MSKAVLISIRPKWCQKIVSCVHSWYCDSCAMHLENNGTCGNESLRLKRPPLSWMYVEAVE